MSTPHALVTGGAGFIGSHLVSQLLEEGWRVTVIDNFDHFYPRPLKEANLVLPRTHPNFRLLEIDIRDSGKLPSALDERVDVLVHLAAKAGVRPSIEDPSTYQEVNVAGTQNLLELARANGIRQFVFASSSSVYGINPRVPWSESDPQLMPISPYAATKLAGEMLGHVYSHLYGMRFIALRFFTVFGPRQRPDLAIHKFTRLLLAGESIPVFGNGSTRRDYTYVGNIVAGIRSAMTYSNSNYEIINLGNHRTVSLLELIQSLEAVTGQRARIKWLPEQPGDVPQTWADTAKARELLGYRTDFDWLEGLARFVNWYLDRYPSARPSEAPTPVFT